MNVESPLNKGDNVNVPDVNVSSPNFDANIEGPKLDTNLEKPSADVNIEGNIGAGVDTPSGEVKAKGPSFMDKLGGLLKINGKKSDEGKKDKRGKKRKRPKGDDTNFDPNINAGASVSVDAPSASLSAPDDTDFVVVDTPKMSKKDFDANVAAPEGEPKPQVEGDLNLQGVGDGKAPKSPSFFRRLGMFFNIGSSGGYDIEGGKKKKKRRKLSSGSKDQSDALKLGADISASDVSVKRDDSFTIPEADLNASNAAAGLSVGGNADFDTKAEGSLGKNVEG